MKKNLLTIFILLSSVFIFPQQAYSQDTLFYKQYGDSLLAKQQYETLITFFSKEVQKYPKQEQILKWLGYTYLHQGDTKNAQRYYEDALTVNPKCLFCYLNLAQSSAMEQNLVGAIKYLNKAITLNPSHAKAYSFRAEMKEKKADTFGALKDYKKSIELAPKNAELFLRRAQFYMRNKYSTLAHNDLSTALELSTDNLQKADILQTKSENYYKQKNYTQALEAISKAIKRVPKETTFYNSRAAIYNAQKEYDKSIADYSLALKIKPNDAFSYYYRGLTYHQLENMDAACTDYQQLKILTETDTEIDPSYKNLASSLVEEFCNTTKASYYYQRGIAAYNLGNYKQAVDYYDNGLRKYPNNPMLLSFMGNALMKLEKYKEATEMYELAVKNEDKLLINNELLVDFKDYKIRFSHSNLLSLAECFLYIDEIQKAKSTVLASIEISTNFEEPKLKAIDLNVYGLILLNDGNYKKALKTFNESIDQDALTGITYVNRAIAKVSLSENVTTRTMFLSGKIKNQPIGVHWKIPTKNKTSVKLQSAITDCDTAIGLENLPYAYYIRSQIKMMVNEDYCADLLKAKALGIEVEKELLKKCL